MQNLKMPADSRPAADRIANASSLTAQWRSKTDIEGGNAMIEREQEKREESHMADVTIVYWRDMPAQVIVGRGRRGVKLPLPERFEQAIDRAAMKSGAAESDDYMAGFRKADPIPVDGTDQEAAEATVAKIDAEYDLERIKTLIANDGWA
jgi:predicted secreted protein